MGLKSTFAYRLCFVREDGEPVSCFAVNGGRASHVVDARSTQVSSSSTLFDETRRLLHRSLHIKSTDTLGRTVMPPTHSQEGQAGTYRSGMPSKFKNPTTIYISLSGLLVCLSLDANEGARSETENPPGQRRNILSRSFLENRRASTASSASARRCNKTNNSDGSSMDQKKQAGPCRSVLLAGVHMLVIFCHHPP